MWAIGKRAAPPILLLLAGLTLLVHGARRHSVAVLDWHEEEITPPPPPPFFADRPPGLGGPRPPFFPPRLPMPPREPEIVLRLDRVVEPEHKLVLEVTRGGVIRLDDGRIKRTYNSSGAPPSGCPT